MSRYDDNKAGDQRLQAQAQAEFDFAQTLEEWGIDIDQFMAEAGLSLHQFDVLAHSMYNVNDEEPSLMALVRVGMTAVRYTQQNRKTRMEGRRTLAAA